MDQEYNYIAPCPIYEPLDFGTSCGDLWFTSLRDLNIAVCYDWYPVDWQTRQNDMSCENGVYEPSPVVQSSTWLDPSRQSRTGATDTVVDDEEFCHRKPTAGISTQDICDNGNTAVSSGSNQPVDAFIQPLMAMATINPEGTASLHTNSSDVAIRTCPHCKRKRLECDGHGWRCSSCRRKATVCTAKGCIAAFRTPNSYRKHERVHITKKPCERCRKVFRSASGRTNHLRVCQTPPTLDE